MHIFPRIHLLYTNIIYQNLLATPYCYTVATLLTPGVDSWLNLRIFEIGEKKILTNTTIYTTIKCSINTTITNQQTVNATDIRFNLGKILESLGRQGNPFLIISRSKPKAWLYPYESIPSSSEELFLKWGKVVSTKYKKMSAKNMIAIIRKDRERI